MAAFFRLREDSVELFVRLTPRSSRDAVDGVETSADGRSYLAARVRAVPEKGAANVALEKLVASMLHLPRSAVAVSAGATARLKTLRIAGNPADLGSRLEELAKPQR